MHLKPLLKHIELTFIQPSATTTRQCDRAPTQLHAINKCQSSLATGFHQKLITHLEVAFCSLKTNWSLDIHEIDPSHPNPPVVLGLSSFCGPSSCCYVKNRPSTPPTNTHRIHRAENRKPARWRNQSRTIPSRLEAEPDRSSRLQNQALATVPRWR